MPVDPFDAQQVSDGLLDYLRAHMALDGLRFAEQPERIGRGMDTYIYSFRLAGDRLATEWERPLVLRLYAGEGDGAKAEREAAVQRFVTSRGYPALEPLAVETHAPGFGLPLMIMERAPGVPMLERIGVNPLAVRRQFAAMAQAHAALHRLPVDGCSLPSAGPLVERRLSEFRDRVARSGLRDLDAPLAWLGERKHVVIPEELSVCHNDFHPLNILVADNGRLTVLDWSDAALGDRLHDVARTLALFHFAWIASESRLERIALRLGRSFLASSYLRPYRRLLPFDERRLHYWMALQVFGGWLQIADLGGIEDFEAEGIRRDSVQRLPPDLLPLLREYFWRLAKR